MNLSSFVFSQLDGLLTVAEEVLRNPGLRFGRRIKAWGWEEVSISLALATGRRMGEIHSSGQFQIAGPQSVLFSSQSNQDVEIPSLVPSDLVVSGLDWLGRNTTSESGTSLRTPNHKDVNRIFSMQLSYAMRDGIMRIDLPDGNHLPYKGLRSLYAGVVCRNLEDYARIMGCSREHVERYVSLAADPHLSA